MTMLTLSELDSYSKKFLQDWESKSSVRSQKRSRFNAANLPDLELSFILKPYLHYPEIAQLKRDQLTPFYLQAACDLLYGVAHFEVAFVTEQCGKLASTPFPIELTDAVKQVAIAIGTDEMYHALVAREMLSDIKEQTGYIPTAEKKLHENQPPAGKEKSKSDGADAQIQALAPPLEFFKKEAPDHLKPVSEATLLCIAENSLVDDFIELARDLGTKNPFSIYNREHLNDESRHKVFFQKLMQYMWSNITEKDRVDLGLVLANYYEKYYLSNYDTLEGWYYSQIKGLEIEDSIKKRIAGEIAEEESKKKLFEKEFISNPVRLMKFAGILDHEPTYNSFVEKGLVPELLQIA